MPFIRENRVKTISITNHRELPKEYAHWLIIEPTLAEAQAVMKRRYPTYDCPAVYTLGNHHWFVMDWKR